MKAKSVVTGLLLGFVALSVAAIVVKEARRRAAAPVVAPELTGQVALYFHGDQRCPTCLQIEQRSRAILEPRVAWRSVNLDEPQHRRFIGELKLTARTLVLAEYRDGRAVRWQALDEVWTLARDEPAFTRYVTTAADNFLAGAPQ